MKNTRNAMFAIFVIALFGAAMAPVESAQAEAAGELRAGRGPPFPIGLEGGLQAKAEASIGEAADAVARLDARISASAGSSNETARSVQTLLAQAKEQLGRAREAYGAGRYGEALGLSTSANALAENGLRLAEKGLEARGELEERYRESRDNASSAEEKVRERRKSFEELREKFRDAQRRGDEQAIVRQCNGAVKEAKEVLRLAQRLLKATLDQVADFGDSVVSANVTANGLSAELRAEISADESGIAANLTVHVEAIPDNVTTKAQCEEARERIRTASESIRDELQDLQWRYKRYVCMGLATRTHHLIANVERFVDRLESQGVDVKDLRAKIAEAKVKAQDLVAKCRSIRKEGASELFQASNAIVKEIRALLQEVLRSVRPEPSPTPTPSPTPSPSPTPTPTPTPSPTPPNITAYGNNRTGDASLNVTLNVSEAIRFYATADQPITLWRWSVNGAEVSNNYDNLTVSWAVNTTLGVYNAVAVNATNGNGTSPTVQWSVTVNALANATA